MSYSLLQPKTILANVDSKCVSSFVLCHNKSVKVSIDITE